VRGISVPTPHGVSIGGDWPYQWKKGFCYYDDLEQHGFHAEANDFRHKAAVVTGSTSGIGIGIAEAFAKARINVVLNGFGERIGSRSHGRGRQGDRAARVSGIAGGIRVR
jgi:hypothetical protein